MGIEPTSSAWKADILADVLYPQLQKRLYHNFPQMSSTNLMVTPSGANAPAPPRGRLMEVPKSLSTPRKAVSLDRLSPAGEGLSRQRQNGERVARRSCDERGIKQKKHRTFLCSAFLSGGDYRDRTGDLLHAMQALSRTTLKRTPRKACVNGYDLALILQIRLKSVFLSNNQHSCMRTI